MGYDAVNVMFEVISNSFNRQFPMKINYISYDSYDHEINKIPIFKYIFIFNWDLLNELR